ncbi:Homeobox-leucine zipper protein [Arachis hypogaea]|nr:Homeobox-leucine zipper protein [Arachis hypogaea]
MEEAINQLYAPHLRQHNQTLFHPSQPSFQGSKSVVNFESVSVSGSGPLLLEDNTFGVDDEDYDCCLQQQGSSYKKKRLRSDQVEFLEKSFEVDNKLEPERKFQLAKQIGLHPRQVAIWFQNRRARFKTKRIEKDFAALKQSFDTLQQQYDLLLRDNLNLQQQVDSLKKRVIPREEGLDDGVNSKHIIEEVGVNMISKVEDTTTTTNSSKSDVLDSDSPNYTDGNHSSSPHHDFSSHHQQHNNNNNLLKTLSFLPKIEDDDDHDNTCNFGLPVVDEDQAFDFWSY